MKLAHSTKIAAWFLVGLNFLMALGAIWIFMRMAPAIEIILDRNAKSLHACEKMLTSLALSDPSSPAQNKTLQVVFADALDTAQNNITETGEPNVLNSIETTYENAFSDDFTATNQTINAIIELADINREAMAQADARARQLGNGGAWGIVFMATVVFFTGMIFIRSITTNLITPLLEIHETITANSNGDTMRRCSIANPPNDIKIIFNTINEFLDKHSTQTTLGPE